MMYDPAIISYVLGGAVVLLLVLGIPLAFSTGFVAVAASMLLMGPNGLYIIASRTYSFFDSSALAAVPLFILMASTLERSSLARDLYQAIYIWTARLPGGVALVTVFVGVILAAAVGVVGGEIVLLGLIALPQMLRLGYDRKLAIGTVCASGSLGTMVPPSIVLIFYGINTSTDVSALFKAAVIPGLLLAVMYCLYIVLRTLLNPRVAPRPSVEEMQIPLREKLKITAGIVPALAVVLCVMGSIYIGLASVTEAAALGVLGTYIATAIRKELSFDVVRGALKQTMSTCGMVLWLVVGTNALIGIYTVVGGVDFLRDQFADLTIAPIYVILLMLGVFFIMGAFIDWLGVLLLTMPVFAPVVADLGYDLVWFGILFSLTMQAAYLTPPFAPAAFYLKGVVSDDISLGEILNSMWPFIAAQLLTLALVLFYPPLTGLLN
ncbi:TRAP transporter large permease subunit [Salipiger pacificus]|nr:TRAP transporter large permease subunit [Alloyangia pacifica]